MSNQMIQRPSIRDVYKRNFDPVHRRDRPGMGRPMGPMGESYKAIIDVMREKIPRGRRQRRWKDDVEKLLEELGVER